MGWFTTLRDYSSYGLVDPYTQKHDPGLIGTALKPAPPTPTPPTPPTPPNMINSQQALDEADQEMAMRLARGRTSTMLNGGAGFSDAGNTSKVLLGR